MQSCLAQVFVDENLNLKLLRVLLTISGHLILFDPAMKNTPSFLLSTIRFLAIALTGLALGVFFAACPSGDKKKSGGKYSYKLECNGDQAIVTKINNETDNPKEKGPVALKANMTCDQAEDLKETDIKKLQKDGQWEVFFTKVNQVQSSGLYKKGKREGEWITFYLSSKAKLKTTQYSGGKKNGPEISYFDSGPVKIEGQNSNNKKSGNWKFYNAVDANCITQGGFSNNKKNGTWEECKKSAKTKKWYLAFKGSYRQGLRDGPATFTNADGKVTMEGNYRADTSEACKKDPPKSGTPPISKPENCGKKEGKWKFYSEEGKLISEGDYKNGKRNGSWVQYYKTGEKAAEGNRSWEHKGFKKGQWTFYNKDGSKIGKFTFEGREFFASHAVLYKNNKKISEGGLTMGIVKYDPDTDTIPKPTLKSGGHWKYYENGKLVREGGMNMGFKQGSWKFYKNGRVVGQGEMISNKKNGKWSEIKGGRMVTQCYSLGRKSKCR